MLQFDVLRQHRWVFPAVSSPGRARQIAQMFHGLDFDGGLPDGIGEFEQRHGHLSAYDETELANMGSRHDAGASWRSIRLYRCRSRCASPAHDSVPYVRLGVTLTATMRVPRVPRLSGDALPYRLHVGTVRNGKGLRIPICLSPLLGKAALWPVS